MCADLAKYKQIYFTACRLS